MSNKFKDRDIKNHTHNFLNDTIYIKIFMEIKLGIDEKSYKNIFIYYMGSVTIKDSKYLKINSVNSKDDSKEKMIKIWKTVE